MAQWRLRVQTDDGFIQQRNVNLDIPVPAYHVTATLTPLQAGEHPRLGPARLLRPADVSESGWGWYPWGSTWGE